jgi:hypothetical protein
MKFVHSLDDNVLTHLAGGLTALVAAATALFSGPILFPHVSASDSEVVDTATESAGDDTATVGVLYPQADMVLLTEATTAQGLNDRSSEREEAVDAMNVEIDVLLQRMKDKPQRRR